MFLVFTFSRNSSFYSIISGLPAAREQRKRRMIGMAIKFVILDKYYIPIIAFNIKSFHKTMPSSLEENWYWFFTGCAAAISAYHFDYINNHYVLLRKNSNQLITLIIGQCLPEKQPKTCPPCEGQPRGRVSANPQDHFRKDQGPKLAACSLLQRRTTFFRRKGHAYRQKHHSLCQSRPRIEDHH